VALRARGDRALVALTAPVLALQLGFPDEGTLPESTTERLAYDLVAEGFGPGLNGPLWSPSTSLVTCGGRRRPARRRHRRRPGHRRGRLHPHRRRRRVGTIVAFPTTSPQDDRHVRDRRAAAQPTCSPPPSPRAPATAHVGGQTASFGDVADRVSQRLPWFIAAVVVLSFLLLMIVFRSVLVPLKAALLNLLSIGAAYGVLVMVFQWGWGKELIGLESTVPIVSFIPMFMFAVLFGLSMDYEVFLLSRVREEYLAPATTTAR
jgi:putative drug exporter of the RND superfamily